MGKSKRTYQTGSYLRLDAKKVRLYVSMGTGLGNTRKRVSKTVEAKTDAQAERLLAAFVREVQGRRSVGGLTLAALMDDFQELYASTLTENTRRWYRDALRRAYGALGHVKLTELTATMIAKYYKRLADPDSKPFVEGYENGLSAITVHHHHKALSAVLQWAYRQELIDRPIIDRVKAPEGGGRSAHAFALDGAQRAAFLAALEAEAARSAQSVSADMRELQALGWALMGRIALACGLRRGELIGLSWADLEMADCSVTLHVRQQVQLSSGKPTLCELKTPTSRRDIPAPATLAADFMRLRQLQREHFMRYGLGRCDLVFATLQGTPRAPAHISRWFRSVFDEAGMPDATLHTLRHTCGSVLLSQGFSAADVAAYLGHSTPTTTLGVYAHAQSEQLARMAAACAVLLR